MPPKNYNCTQEDLYIAADLAWTNYGTNQSSFLALKGKYTASYGTDAISAILAAKNLPNEQVRVAIPENIRESLLPLGYTCLANQRKLKSYIDEVYKGNTGKTMLSAAGYDEYHAAQNESWSDMMTMISLGAIFINSHTATLEAGTSNMPTAFIATYGTGKTAFETMYNSFLTSSQATSGGTDAKIAANNAVYKTVTGMLADGKIIFENNGTTKKLFVWDTLLSQVSGNGTTGLRVTLKDSISLLNETNFTVTVQPGDITEQSAGDKVLKIEMAANTYAITVTATGYPVYTNNKVKLKTGSFRHLNLVLVKI